MTFPEMKENLFNLVSSLLVLKSSRESTSVPHSENKNVLQIMANFIYTEVMYLPLRH